MCERDFRSDLHQCWSDEKGGGGYVVEDRQEKWGEGGSVVLYFLCRSLLFFRARKMGLCNESRDRARNSGGATAAFALPSRSRAFLAASTRTRSSPPKKTERHSETRPERGIFGKLDSRRGTEQTLGV